MTEEPLVRRLSLLGIWLLMINGMIGAGIFGIPAESYRLVGVFSPWLFILCGLAILPNMLCFAQLGSYFSGTGGPVLYATEAFGGFAGFQTGWCLYVARLTAFAANANLVVNSLAHFWGGAVPALPRTLLLAAICGMLTALNIRGTKGAIGSLGVITIVKAVPLLLLAALGLGHLDLAFPQGPLAVDGGLGAAMPLVTYAYVGFESGLITAGEARQPRRDVPRALLIALALCALMYFLIQLAAMSVLPGMAGSDRTLTDIAGALMGPSGALLLAMGTVASVTGHLMGTMFAVPRITYRLGLDGYLPHWFAKVHHRYRTPYCSIAFMGAIGFLLAASGSFVWLAGLSVLTRLPVWICCIAAIPRLKRRYGDAPEAMRVPGGLTVPVVAGLSCLALMTQVTGSAFIGAGLFLLAGSGLYRVARRAAAKAA